LFKCSKPDKFPAKFYQKPKGLHSRLILLLTLLVFCMFGFTFALVPLYNVFCTLTGLNGKMEIKTASHYARYKIDSAQLPERLITVEFDVNRNQNLPCEFSPQHAVLQVKTGELNHTAYIIKNLSNRTLTIQAIPSISPGVAAKYLKKLECFCFNTQTLKPKETLKLDLRFWLEPELPDSIRRFTLSYTLFDVTKQNKDLAKKGEFGET
jgi:cytochrome c oxidase assembly protein subunit 11